MIWIAITLLILGLFGAGILRRHLHRAKLLRLREIMHQERMAAMERGLPAPEADAAKIEALLADDGGAGTNPDRMGRAGVQWVRLAALALGLTCLFGGAGMMPGFYFVPDPEASGLWPLGLIPILIGVGLLLFVRLSSGLAEKINGGRESA